VADELKTGELPDFVDEEEPEELEEESRSRRRLRWGSLSYTTRVTISFSLIAAMTALVAIGVVSLVWEQHFHTYTQDNMHAVAETTADQIAELYEEVGHFDDNVLQPAKSAVAVSKGVGMQVVDTNDNVLFDSTVLADGVEGIITPSIAPAKGQDNMARAAIVADDTAIGSVRVWVYGSDQLLRSADQEFRDRS